MMLTDLAETLTDVGLDVVEVDGWRTRATTDDRRRREEMISVDGVTCHHTASGRGLGRTLGLATIVHGRTDLEGPLAHLYLNREGVFFVVAAGRCNHAGVSRKPTYTNAHRIGIEALAAGDGWSQDWPDVQMDAYALGCKALSRRYRFPVDEVLGHKETCAPQGRKTDPSFNMTAFRTRVDKATRKQAQEMDWSDPRKLTAADALAYGGTKKEGDLSSWSATLRFPPATARLRREVKEQTDSIQREMKAQFAQVHLENAQLRGQLTDITATLNEVLNRLPPAPQ